MKFYSYKLLSLCLGVVALAASCNKDYLNTFPTTAVGEEDALSTTQSAMAALNGIHRIMYVQYDQQGQAGEGSNNIFRDLMGEDIVYPRAAGSTGLIGWMQWQNHRNVSASDLRYMYRYYYRIISNANKLIHGVDKASGPDAEKRIIKGQALAYRGWAHFQLVQLWGKRYDADARPNNQLGVPLMLTNTLEGQPRATVEQVYTQVNKDLDEALVLLAGYNRTGSAAKSNLNVNVVRGIKARVALTQQNWEAAATNAIAARAGFPLMDTVAYKSGFNNINNAEWIWGSRQVDDQNTFFFSYFAYISQNFNSTVIRTQPRAINATLWNAIPVEDVRKRMWDRTGANVDVPRVNGAPVGARVPYQNMKFSAQGYSSSVGDVPYMRAAEMFLIEAEARARQGQNGPAQDALFAVVKARNAAALKSTATGDDLLNEIFFNRRIEFWGEGFRFTDLKRTNSPLNRNGIPNHLAALIQVYDIPAGDPRWEFIFPQDELNANKEIVQNP